MAASAITICNFALTKCGQDRIAALSDNNARARAVNSCYDQLRQQELETYPWSFALKRVALAQAADAPAFGYTYAYDLPADFLRLAVWDRNIWGQPPDVVQEGRQLLANMTSLAIRYVRDVENANEMSPLFRAALGYAIAMHVVEELTQSKGLNQLLSKGYDQTIARARQVNAIQKRPVEPQVDDFIAARDDGMDPTQYHF